MPHTGAGAYRAQSSIDTKFFTDNGVWRDAPILKGTTCFEPLPDVRNIMVTGGAGFMASWMVRHLTLTYPHAYKIICFDKLDYCASLANVRQLTGEANFVFEHGDITSSADVRRCLAKHRVDTVLHFAAQSHVDLSFGNSFDFTGTNVYGTHVLLESATRHGVGRFVHVSTDEVYGEVGDGEADLVEASLLAPTNPYAATKAAAEMLVHAYHKSFKLPVMVVRANNFYGPHQYPEKVIPKFALLLHRGDRLLLHGDGGHTRRYLHGADACDAFDTILHRGAVGHIYNIPSRDEVSNRDLCARLLDLFGRPNRTPEDFYASVEHTRDRPFNDRRYAVDGTKLRALGWEQKVPFADGLRQTVDWYRRFGDTWWGDIDSLFTAFPVVQEGALSPARSKRACLEHDEAERAAVEPLSLAQHNLAAHEQNASAAVGTDGANGGSHQNGESNSQERANGLKRKVDEVLV